MYPYHSSQSLFVCISLLSALSFLDQSTCSSHDRTRAYFSSALIVLRCVPLSDIKVCDLFVPFDIFLVAFPAYLILSFSSPFAGYLILFHPNPYCLLRIRDHFTSLNSFLYIASNTIKIKCLQAHKYYCLF
jgi:hypothetical protein